MKRVLLLLIAAALPALAQAPSQFRSAAPITLSGTDALHRLELPFEVYAGGRRDLGDVRIFNKDGSAVPIAFAGDPEAQREVLALVELPQFPVSTLAQTVAGAKGAEVTVRTQDGTLVSIKGGKAGAAAPKSRVAAILLDASQVEEPVQALIFDWDAAPGTEVVRVRAEASDDLKTWSALGSGPLVRLASEGRALTQPKLEFAPRKAKYLRLTWDAPGFSVKRVRAERVPRVQPAPRATRTVTATPGEKPGEWLYDLAAPVPVEAFRLLPQATNDVVSASILTRNDAKQAWRQAAWAPFYRLQLEGTEKQSPPLEIGRLPARYWMARIAGRSEGAAPPALEVQWRPAQVVFVAHGSAPYSLGFGNAQAAPVAMPISALIPDYKRLAEMKLPVAKVGAVTSGPQPTRWEQWVSEASPKRIALWVVLLAGVVVLGFMAWRLLRAPPA